MTTYTTVAYDEIIRDEPYAYRFRVGDKEPWIPKEAITKHDKEAKTIEIQESLAEKEGLINE
jgi:hypothetical protein